MGLGNFVEVSIGVSELSESLPFFERLGFQKLDQNYEPWPWAILTDGMLTLNLGQYAGPTAPVLNYFASDMSERVNALQQNGVPVFGLQERQLPEVLGGIEAPDGIGISLLKYPARRIPRPSGNPMTRCGVFSQLAYPVADLEAALLFWRKLGFERSGGAGLPYPWATVSDGLITLGLHQTTIFQVGALIYETPDLEARVAEFRADGFEFAERLPGFGANLAGFAFSAPLESLLLVLQQR